MPDYRMRSAHGEVAVPKEQVDPLRKQGWVLLGPVPDFQTSREVLDSVATPDFRSSNLRDEQGQPVVLPEPTRMRAATPEERVMGRLEEEGDINADLVRRQFGRTPNQPQTARPTMRAATFGERLGDSWADTLEAIKPAWIRAANAMQTPEPFHVRFDPTMGSQAPIVPKRGLYSRIDDLLVAGKIGKKGVSPARLAKLTTADRALAEEAQWRGLPDLIEQAGGRKTTQRTIPMDQLRGHLSDNPAPLPIVKTLGGGTGRLVAFKGQDVVHDAVIPARALPQHIGKDAAQQLLSAEVTHGGVRQVNTKNVTVGGAGMRSFYDENRPAAISKILAPFGVKPFRPSTIEVDPTRMNALEARVEPSWFTGWTEEQKAAILKKGLPMSVLLGILLGRPPQAPEQER